MDFKTSQRKCLNEQFDSCWDKSHFMSQLSDSASDCFIVNASDFVDIWRHHKTYVKKCCYYDCSKDTICDLYFKLRKLTDYVEWLRDKNFKKNTIVKTICIVYNIYSTQQKAFWWINIIEWEKVDVPDNVDIRWRAQFC